MRNEKEEGSGGRFLETLEQSIGSPLFEIVRRIDHDRTARAERRPSGQPPLHGANLVNGDVALDLVRLSFLALLLVVGGRGQRLEHDHVGMIARLYCSALRNQFARCLQCKRSLSRAASPGQDPTMMEARAGLCGMPLTPGLIMASEVHCPASNSGASDSTIRR